MFVLYAIAGLVAGLIYRRLPSADVTVGDAPPSALGPSRRIVYRLAALFSLDAFAGGLVVQSLLALWLLEAFGLSLAVTAQLFFWSGLLTALSYLVAVPLARRIGLINTMVFTHLPANLCLIAVPFVAELWQVVALLLVRSLLSQMDVPTRTSYVMAVVTPAERQAAASLTAVPRSLAAAVSPSLAGWMLASASFGWPLLLAGALKIAYDLMLLAQFRHVRPPEEQRRSTGPRVCTVEFAIAGTITETGAAAPCLRQPEGPARPRRAQSLLPSAARITAPRCASRAAFGSTSLNVLPLATRTRRVRTIVSAPLIPRTLGPSPEQVARDHHVGGGQNWMPIPHLTAYIRGDLANQNASGANAIRLSLPALSARKCALAIGSIRRM